MVVVLRGTAFDGHFFLGFWRLSATALRLQAGCRTGRPSIWATAAWQADLLLALALLHILGVLETVLVVGIWEREEVGIWEREEEEEQVRCGE